MRQYRLIRALLFVGLLGACSSEEDSSNAACSATNLTGTCNEGTHCDGGTCVSDQILMDIGGSLSIHPASFAMAAAGGNAASLNFAPEDASHGIALFIYNPFMLVTKGVAFDPATDSLIKIPIDPSSCTDTAKGPVCTFSANGLDVTNVTLGLMGLLVDTRSTPTFVTTNTGLVGAGTLSTVKASGTGLTGLKAFGVTRSSMNAFAALTNGAYSAEQMIAKGTLLGVMVNSAGQPVADTTVQLGTCATATPPSATAPYYPNATFSGVGSATTAGGLFFSVANPEAATPAAVVCANLTASGGGASWPTVPQMGVGPGSVAVLMYMAQ